MISLMVKAPASRRPRKPVATFICPSPHHQHTFRRSSVSRFVIYFLVYDIFIKIFFSSLCLVFSLLSCKRELSCRGLYTSYFNSLLNRRQAHTIVIAIAFEKRFAVRERKSFKLTSYLWFNIWFKFQMLARSLSQLDIIANAIYWTTTPLRKWRDSCSWVNMKRSCRLGRHWWTLDSPWKDLF